MIKRSRRYETDPKEHIARCKQYLDSHALAHKKDEKCSDCWFAERFADGIAHLSDALGEVKRLQNQIDEMVEPSDPSPVYPWGDSSPKGEYVGD